MQHTQMMLHGDQHDVRIFQAKMSFAFGCIQRALTFGIRIQRIVAVRMLIIGNRPLIPTTAHRQCVDDRDIAGTIAFRISSDVQHEKAMLEPGVMRNIWLLFESLQQSDLSFGPFVEQTKVRAGAIAHVNTGKVENQRIAKQRILRGNAEGKTCLAICIAGLVIILFVAVARGLAGRTRRDHVHEFESGIDDVHASRIRTRSFDINAHHRVDVTAGKVEILQNVDRIYIDALRAAGLYDKVWQAGAILLPVKSVGVMGDERTYESCVALRAVTSTDGMTADWVHLPYEFLADVSNEIINKVRGVNRVVYDISSKPPATIEWE